MNKKNILLIIMGIALIIFFASLSLTDFNFSSLATDSGFDTSYDGGSYSGDGGDGSSIIYLIYLFIEYPLPTIMFVLFIVIYTILQHNKNHYFDNNLNYQFIEQKYKGMKNKEILLSAYQIFYEVQMAWMNFDYNRLKELLSDELYNMYYNELETLKLKGHKNIMEGFKVKQIFLIETKEKNGVIEHSVNLKVAFFDYIVDSGGIVVRGNKGTYHVMDYILTFASASKKLDCCPNCSAPLPENSICDYCGSHVQGLREMRLVKKVNVRQRRVE